jgi:hypothetical protein
MSSAPTLQALAFYAREHFGEDGYPFEESIPSSFDLVLSAYLDAAKWGLIASAPDRARSAVAERLRGRTGFAPVSDVAVRTFVENSLTYLESQFRGTAEAREHRQELSHIFWGNLVESREMYGPLRHAACSCGHVMTGRSDEDLYGLVRRHLVGQSDPVRHEQVSLPEQTVRRRLVAEQDLKTSSSVEWRAPVPVG